VTVWPNRANFLCTSLCFFSVHKKWYRFINKEFTFYVSLSSISQSKKSGTPIQHRCLVGSSWQRTFVSKFQPVRNVQKVYARMVTIFPTIQDIGGSYWWGRHLTHVSKIFPMVVGYAVLMRPASHVHLHSSEDAMHKKLPIIKLYMEDESNYYIFIFQFSTHIQNPQIWKPDIIKCLFRMVSCV